MLALRNIAMIVLFPGTVVVYIPYRLLTPPSLPPLRLTDPRQLAALGVIALGLGLLLSCVWCFARIGRGTLAPFDETHRLVVVGPYRYVRNPMYIAVLLMLLGESWLFWSATLLRYSALCFVIANVLVIGYEEIRLRHKYGDEFRDYCREVGRWLPGRPYEP